MAFWMKKLAGKIGGEDDNGAAQAQAEAEAKAEEERRERERLERERQKAEEERRRQEAEARREEREREAREREEERQREEEERQDRLSMREGTGSGETDALGSFEGAPEPPEPSPPVIELEPQVIDVPGVSIPENEIQVTPFGDPDRDGDALGDNDRDGDGPQMQPAPQLSPMDRVADIAIAQGSQQSMAEQGYGPPAPTPAPQPNAPEDNAQRDALRALASENAGGLTPPSPMPQGAAMGKPGGPQATGVTSPKPMGPAGSMRPPEDEEDPNLLELQRAADATAQRGQARNEELERAQRRDRILKAIGALAGLGGMVGNAVARQTGNRAGQIGGAAVAGLGRMTSGLAGYGDDTALRQRGQRQDESLEASQRRAVTTARNYDRQLDLTENAQRQRAALAKANRDDQRMAANREAARADELAPLERAIRQAQLERQRAQTEQERLETDLERASNDPTSERSRRAQDRIVANLDTLKRRGLNRTEADIRRMSERELMVETQALGRVASTRTRGGARGGSGGSRTIPIPDSLRQRVAEEYPDATPAEREAIARRVIREEGADILTSTDARQAARERREMQGRQQIGNFVLREGREPPDETTWRKIQDDLAALRTIDRQLGRMASLVEGADWRDALRSATGVNNEATGEYTVLRDRVMSAIQSMSGGGVLTDGDVERLSALVPSLERGWVSGGEHALRAIQRDARNVTRERMDARGYNYGEQSNGDSSGDGGRSGGRRTYRVEATDGTTTREMTPEEAAQRRAQGFRVTEVR